MKDLIDTTKLIQKFLPKQTDIDKILDIIKRKVLKGTHLPLIIKEIQAGYLSALTHIIQIRSNFDVANLSQYHAGFAPMLFQWSHSHTQHFLL